MCVCVSLCVCVCAREEVRQNEEGNPDPEKIHKRLRVNLT